MHIHNVSIDRVPQVRRERALEAAHKIIQFDESKTRPWVHHFRVRQSGWGLDGRNIIRVFREAPGTVSEVEILNLGEDDRGLDHQNERISLTLGVGEEDVRVMEPLSFLRKYERLSPVNCQYPPSDARIQRDSYPLVELVSSQREKLGDIHIILRCPPSVLQQ